MTRKPIAAILTGLGLSIFTPAFAQAPEPCAGLDALIKSGQGDVPFETYRAKRAGAERHGPIIAGTMQVAPFELCRIDDEVDEVGRESTTLSCNNQEPDYSEETRASFLANEVEAFVDLIECMTAKEDWNFYQSHQWNSEIAWSGHLRTEAETRLEDAIGIEMKIEQPMGIEKNRMNLNLTLRTVPRDYR